jgi:hypothetical protein
LKELGASLEEVGSSSGRTDSSERRTAVGCGRLGSLIASVSAIDPLTSLKIEGWVDVNDSGSLNETGGSGVDVLDGAVISWSGTDSG